VSWVKGKDEQRKMLGRAVRASFCLLGISARKAARLLNKEECLFRDITGARIYDVRPRIKILCDQIPGFYRAFRICVSYFSEEKNAKN
jgi:hypothetical protein